MSTLATSASARRNPQAGTIADPFPTPPTSDSLNQYIQGFDLPLDYDDEGTRAEVAQHRQIPTRGGSLALQQPPPIVPVVYKPPLAQQQQYQGYPGYYQTPLPQQQQQQQQPARSHQTSYQPGFPAYSGYPPPQQPQMQTQPIHPYSHSAQYHPQDNHHAHKQGSVFSQPLPMPQPVQYAPVAASYGQPADQYSPQPAANYTRPGHQPQQYPKVQIPRQQSQSPLPPSPILSPQQYHQAIPPAPSSAHYQERPRQPSESSSVFSVQQQLPSPGSPLPDSLLNPYRQSMTMSPVQANQELANLTLSLSGPLSNLSLGQSSDNSGGFQRNASVASSGSVHRRDTALSDRSSTSLERNNTGYLNHQSRNIRAGASDTSSVRRGTIPANLHPDTITALMGLPIEDMPSCFIVAPPLTSSSTNGHFTPFRIMAPCQAILIKDGTRGPPHHHALHMPEDQGYSVNNPEAIITAHGTILRQMAITGWMLSSSLEPSFGKSLANHAEKFLKIAQPVEKVTYPLDPPETDHSRVARGASVTASGGTDTPLAGGHYGTPTKDTGKVLIEKHLFEYRHMDALAKLMRDITGSRLSSDWTGGLCKITLPLKGQHHHYQTQQQPQTLWVCHNCIAGFESGRYAWHDQQAKLPDLISLPVFNGLRTEAKLYNALAIEVFTRMSVVYQKMSAPKATDPKQVVLHLSSSFFDQPDRGIAAVFTKNQKLFESLSLALTSTHMTRVEIHGHQKPGLAELPDANNIYLYMRRIFECYHLQIVKITGMPYLLRNKLGMFLGKAVDIHLDGVLLDTDMAIANMKKIIVENTDMTHLTLKNARLKSSGLKTICSTHKHLRRLVVLDLSENSLDADGIKDLSTLVMPTSLNLILLNLSENPAIGPAGCMLLLDSIWPSDKKAQFETKQRGLKYLLLANTGFTDSAASHLSRAFQSRSPGILHTLYLSDNQMTKTGLTDLIQTMEQTAAKGPAVSTLRRVSLNQYCTAIQAQQQTGRLFMDIEVMHTLSLHPFLTHIRLSRLGLEAIAQTLGLNSNLISLVVDDAAVLGGAAVPNSNYALAAKLSYEYAVSSFKTLVDHLETNRTIQELKIYLPQSWASTSFWSLVFQSALDSGDSRAAEGVWSLAAKWMGSLESHLRDNKALRQFAFAGVATAGDPENEKEQEESLRRDWEVVTSDGASAVSEDDRKMAQARLGIRAVLERNQAMFYGRKHGVERLLQQQWV
ncbi:hypothetical protein EMPS_06801 [Entomortierella parvispora]|uniref:RNI-like protein n=1 Tax=Entomortierella parvispora TaxID=205924 RepID=A0A9P3HDE5_9FUNG|nr:hypothetical protein EMPS_06801 [Entomortierella parvispora]